MKKFFAKIHLWLSIPFGIIIAIVCLTGAILVFETEILELCYPSRYFVKEVKGEVLSPAVLMSAAGQQLPDSIKINGIRVSSDPKRTYQLILPGKKAACFINPYTGEITGIDDGKGFFMKMMRLHRWLLDEYKRDGSFAWGKTIVGFNPGIGHYHHQRPCYLVSEKQESTEKPAQNKNKSRLVPFPVRSTCLRRFLCCFTFACPGIDRPDLVVRLVS